MGERGGGGGEEAGGGERERGGGSGSGRRTRGEKSWTVSLRRLTNVFLRFGFAAVMDCGGCAVAAKNPRWFLKAARANSCNLVRHSEQDNAGLASSKKLP